MSHFTVTIRVASDVPKHGVEAAVKKLLAPFDENREVDFHDTEAEYRNEYETEGCDMVIMPDGTLVYTRDDRFRIPGAFGVGHGTHKVPDDLIRREVPHKERFATFDDFLVGWHGSANRDDQGRLGYWKNPQAKWDWYTLGGRWRGMLPVHHSVDDVIRVSPSRYGDPDDDKPILYRGADGCRIRDLDTTTLTIEHAKKLAAAWATWTLLREEKFEEWAEVDARQSAMRTGLIVCVPNDDEHATEIGGYLDKGYSRHDWTRAGDTGPGMTDLWNPISEADWRRAWADHFWPIRTYARLDVNGWVAPGEMGWFGFSDDTADTSAAYATAFREWLAGGDQGDWIVIVDCHI